MPWTSLVYILTLLIGTAGISILALSLWRSRPVRGAPTLILMMLAGAIWALGYAAEILAPTLAAKTLCAKLQYLGIPFVPLGIFIFTMHYTERRRWLTGRNRFLLAALPVATTLLAFTNESHHLLWLDVLLQPGDAGQPLILVHGPWFWALVAYSYLLLILSTAAYVQIIVQAEQLFRSQALVMLAGLLMPWIANFLYITNLNPFPNLDLTPLALSLTSYALVIGSLRFGILEIMPAAYSAVFHAMEDGVIVLNHKNQILHMNPAARQIFHQDTMDYAGKTLQDRIPTWLGGAACPDQIEPLPDEICLQVNGEQRIYQVRTANMTNRRSQLTGQAVILNEITAHKKAEAQLQAAAEQLRLAHHQALETSRLKTQLLANVSHDLRSPLGTIIGFAKLLQSGRLGPNSEGQDAAAEAILNSANQMLTFANNLVVQAQLETGRILLNNQPFDPNELIEAALSTAGLPAAQKGLAFSYHMDPQLPATLVGDIYWLRQIMVNLASNAVKFTDHGEIQVKFLQTSPKYWSIQVSDTGIGISLEEQPFIFENFRQLKNGLGLGSGSGLGLYIVQQLSQQMGGQVMVQSQVDQGSIFTVTLPMLESPEE